MLPDGLILLQRDHTHPSPRSCASIPGIYGVILSHEFTGTKSEMSWTLNEKFDELDGQMSDRVMVSFMERMIACKAKWEGVVCPILVFTFKLKLFPKRILCPLSHSIHEYLSLLDFKWKESISFPTIFGFFFLKTVLKEKFFKSYFQRCFRKFVQILYILYNADFEIVKFQIVSRKTVKNLINFL